MVKFNLISVVICLGIVSHSDGQGTSKKRKMSISKFGCVFDNEDYFVRTNSIFNPVYGEQVKALEFSSKEQFESMLQGIKTEYSQLMENLVYTNILDFYEFYDRYKNHVRMFPNTRGANLSSLISFYDNYTPRFIPRHGDASMVVELLDRLTRRYPMMTGSVYLVTSSVNAKETVWVRNKCVGQLLGKNPNEEPPRTFVHNHIAALLRIRVAGAYGYVLMDPVHLMDVPYVSFETTPGDSRSPHQDYVIERLEVRNRNYLYHNIYQIYYIAKPYCSFLMTTTKPNILDTSLQITRRNKVGDIVATITFDVLVNKPAFYMHGRVNFMRQYGPRELTINFGVPGSMKQRLQKEIIDAVNYPGLPELLHKAEAIATDKPFLREFASLVQRRKKIVP